MKKLLLVLALAFFSIGVGAQDNELGYIFLPGSTMDYDKQKHAAVGMFLGGVSYIYFDTNGYNTEMQAYLKSGALVGGVAILKELNDGFLGTSGFNVGDIGATMFGHAIGATTSYFLRKRVKNYDQRQARRKLKKQQEQMARIDSFYKSPTKLKKKKKYAK